MISEDFAFFGFDETSWDRLVSLLVADDGAATPRGVLVIVVDGERIPVACFHTATGSLDPASLPSLADPQALCRETGAGACIIIREPARAELEGYLAAPLDPDQDFVTRVMRFVHVVRELGSGNWLRIWPNPLPDLLLSAVPSAKPAIDFLLPDGQSVVLGIFEGGALWTGAALRRSAEGFDVLAGPGAISEWAGPLGGAWRRDHRVLTRAIERELGPIHIGLFMERSTAHALFSRKQAGEWALAYTTRQLMIHPLPAAAAAALGIDGLSGVAQYAIQALEQMESEELVAIAQGFWRGLTDGKGLEGLLGFSPARMISETLDKARSERPPRNDSPSPSGKPLAEEPAEELAEQPAPPKGRARSRKRRSDPRS
ncbi:MAG: hypothetical protein WBM46_12645 [Polyangiales bacterium]